jgi:hypothetical protein
VTSRDRADGGRAQSNLCVCVCVCTAANSRRLDCAVSYSATPLDAR